MAAAREREDAPLLSGRSTTSSDEAPAAYQGSRSAQRSNDDPPHNPNPQSGSSGQQHEQVPENRTAEATTSEGTAAAAPGEVRADDLLDSDEEVEQQRKEDRICGKDRMSRDEQRRVMAAQQVCWEALPHGQYDLSDVMRVVATTYYAGGDKTEEHFVTLREARHPPHTRH